MTQLSNIFNQIQTASDEMDGIATQILDAIREAQADTLVDFNEMVADAYAENGWSSQRGRPEEGSELTPAPNTIKNYVSQVRRAYKGDLDVMGFETMGALRKAVRSLRSDHGASQQQEGPMLGIKVIGGTKMIGSLWHDVIIVWEHLPSDQKEALETKVQRLLSQYARRTVTEIPIAA